MAHFESWEDWDDEPALKPAPKPAPKPNRKFGVESRKSDLIYVTVYNEEGKVLTNCLNGKISCFCTKRTKGWDPWDSARKCVENMIGVAVEVDNVSCLNFKHNHYFVLVEHCHVNIPKYKTIGMYENKAGDMWYLAPEDLQKYAALHGVVVLDKFARIVKEYENHPLRR